MFKKQRVPARQGTSGSSVKPCAAAAKLPEPEAPQPFGRTAMTTKTAHMINRVYGDGDRTTLMQQLMKSQKKPKIPPIAPQVVCSQARGDPNPNCWGLACEICAYCSGGCIAPGG